MKKHLSLFLVAVFSWGTIAAILATPVLGATQFISPHAEAASLRKGVYPHFFSTSAAHTSEPVIALTFDDGPHPVYTPQVLAVLQRYGVKATFFCIGQQVKAYPSIVRQAFNDGDGIGNHTWNHPLLTALPPDAIRWQLQQTSIAIDNAIGVSPGIYRPPYGATNSQIRGVAAQLGMREVLYTIDPRDWSRPGVNAIVANVLANARNGSIILLHDGGGDRSQTVAALPQIITGLRQRGYSFVFV